MKPFGEQMKDARIGCDMSLRTGASLLILDVSVMSKIERGIDPAPSDPTVIAHWADLLMLTGQARSSFIAAANASAAAGPGPVPTDADVDQSMPAFLPQGALRDAEMVRKFRDTVRQTMTPTAFLPRA